MRSRHTACIYNFITLSVFFFSSVGKMEVEDVHIDTTAALHPESRLSIPTANRLDDDQETKETFLTILYQVVGPLLISGLAMVGAGIYFDFVQVINSVYT